MIKQLKSNKKLSKKTEEALNELQGQVDFENQFIKKDFECKIFEFTKKHLPLINHMRSEKVNDPTNNRDKTKDNVLRLFRCMKAGHWKPQANVLHIDPQGLLLNGQHTLDAAALYFNDATTLKDAKLSIVFFLGSDRDCMPYLDTQKKRLPHQSLRIKEGDLQISLNRTQEAIVLAEGRNTILGSPFAPKGQINFFENENVVKKHSSMLSSIFGSRVLCQDFPHKSVGYALFALAKVDEELASEIMDDICNHHSEALKAKSAPLSKWKNSVKEHDLIEQFREEKFRITNLAVSGGMNKRDGFRQEDFYPIAVNWIVTNYKVDGKVFPI